MLLLVLLAPQAAPSSPLPPEDGPAALVEKLRTEDAVERRRLVLELLKAGTAGAEAALRGLGAPAGDPSARVQELVKGLSATRWADRDRAMRSLGALGRPAREALAKHLDADDPEVSWRARAALAEIEGRAGQEERLDELRSAALVELLGEAGERRAAGPLMALLADGPAERRPEAKFRAAIALGLLRDALSPAQAEEVAERAIAMLERAQESKERAQLLRALGRLRAAAAVRPLAGLLGDRSEMNVHLRVEALRALAQSGRPDALRAAVEALASDEVWVRGAAAAALSALAGEPVEEGPAGTAKARAWWSKRFGRPWD
jgi:HEAT repeat protein